MKTIKPKNEIQRKDEQLVSDIILNGDLSKLAAPQKIQYYNGYCERLGLDPFTKPFELLRLNGKEVLYCTRSGTQQLNKLHNVSHEITSRELIDAAGVYQVTSKACLPGGRCTESIGAVNISGLKGDAYANAIMKAETKAKRRATLDLLGLGVLDETEVESIPNAQPVILEKAKETIQEAEIEQQVDEVEILARKSYTTVEDLLMVLDSCETIGQLNSLYHLNSKLVEDNNIKSHFTTKKNEIRNHAA
jgi:hypothetical protein